MKLPELRTVPGIIWVIAGGVVVLALSAGSIFGIRREEGLEARAAHADSVAREKTIEAVILRRDAAAATARADSLERRADRLAAQLAVTREDIAAQIDRAAASRAKVDTTGLRPDVLEALADADALRIAVAAYLPRDAETIAVYQTAGAESAHAIELHVGAYAEQGAALVAREIQIRAVEQQHAPRCGAKCGAAIGIVLLEAVRAAVQAFAR